MAEPIVDDRPHGVLSVPFPPVRLADPDADVGPLLEVVDLMESADADGLPADLDREPGRILRLLLGEPLVTRLDLLEGQGERRLRVRERSYLDRLDQLVEPLPVLSLDRAEHDLVAL